MSRIGEIINDIPLVLQLLKKGWVWAVIIFAAIIYALFFNTTYRGIEMPVYEKVYLTIKNIFNPETTPVLSRCSSIHLESNISSGPPSYTIGYTTPLNDTIMAEPISDFNLRRMEMIRKEIDNADNQLKNNGYRSYGSRILRFFAPGSDLNRKVLEMLMNKRFLYFDENLDSLNCRYNCSLRLCFTNISEIENILNWITSQGCLSAAIDSLIIQPLNRETEIKTSFPVIFKFICESCANTRSVAEMISQCEDVNNCPKLYFEKAGYELSLLSIMILEPLFEKLQQSSTTHYTIIFSGSTDATPVGFIPYNKGGYIDKYGTLLNGDHNKGSKLDGIRNNDELSFARGYSCFEFFEHKSVNKNLTVYYTGTGVNKTETDGLHQRSVTITIIKN